MGAADRRAGEELIHGEIVLHAVEFEPCEPGIERFQWRCGIGAVPVLERLGEFRHHGQGVAEDGDGLFVRPYPVGIVAGGRTQRALVDAVDRFQDGPDMGVVGLFHPAEARRDVEEVERTVAAVVPVAGADRADALGEAEAGGGVEEQEMLLLVFHDGWGKVWHDVSLWHMGWRSRGRFRSVA
jgi:hypothetical protein